MNITVLGAGAWGTALASSMAARHATCLWARDASQAALMREERCNERYLGGVSLPGPLQVTDDFGAAVAHARNGLLIVATPMAALEEMLHRLPSSLRGVVWLCKGFQQGTGRLAHEVAIEACPDLSVGVLSGPSFALEVAQGRPTALVVASASGAVRDLTVEALHSESLRIYTSDDPVGVEVGGAVKNVLAIATGIADGMPRGTGAADGVPGSIGTAADTIASSGDLAGLGLNARAALITRGLAEMTRLGVALGARAETFTGLSGLGDLVLTTTGDLSRNRKVGLLLAQGLTLPRILGELGHVAEGVLTAPTVLRRAREHGVEMPITDAVVGVLQGSITPRRALERLMGRGARAEV